MPSCDPMTTAIDWIGAYRAASLSIVDLYADGAALECGCENGGVISGRAEIARYWRQRFKEKAAGELTDVLPDGDAVVVSYRVIDGIEQTRLDIDPSGKIRRTRCWPAQAGTSRDQYIWDLTCPVCEASGFARVSEDARPQFRILHFSVDEVSEGFRLGKLGESATDTEIICVKCNAAT